MLALNQDQVKTGFYPQATLDGQITWQSSTIEIPFKIPNVTIPALPLDQYKVSVGLKQLIYDGGNLRDQQQILAANAAIQQQQVEVDAYKLRDKVNQLYFNVILQSATLYYQEILKYDLLNEQERLKAALHAGTMTQQNLDELKVELLKLDEQMQEIKSSRETSILTMGLLTGMKLDTLTRFVEPQLKDYGKLAPRPELQLFDLQQKSLQSQQKLNFTNRLPRFYAFGEGGVGRPAFNIFDPDPQAYFIGGLKLSWTIWDYRRNRLQQQVLTLNSTLIQLQQDYFVQSQAVQELQQNQEIRKLQGLLTTDDAVIKMRAAISKTANDQFEDGILSGKDYFEFVNAESKAKQERKLHELQLLFNQISLLTTQGN